MEYIETRLEIKKLQQKKKKTEQINTDVGPKKKGRGSTRVSRTIMPMLPTCRGGGQHGEVQGTTVSNLSVETQVLASPHRFRVSKVSGSPGRVLLGIDKGLKGRNVSLRKAPSVGKSSVLDDDPFNIKSHCNREVSETPISRYSTFSNHRPAEDRLKTFNKKVAELRQQDKLQREKENRLYTQRSTGFGFQQRDLDSFETAAIDQEKIDDSRLKRNFRVEMKEFCREEVLEPLGKSNGRALHGNYERLEKRTVRDKETFSTIASAKSSLDTPKNLQSSQPSKFALAANHLPTPSKYVAHAFPSLNPHHDSSLFELFSSLHLSKRIIPHTFLSRTLSEKIPVLLPSLLRTVKPPDYSLPDSLDGDYVVFGIIASKSAPISHKNTRKFTTVVSSSSNTEAVDSATNTSGKYMVMTITDLNWSLDLYLFSTAYTRYWKLTQGTLVAILNPSVMPPPPGKADTGRFSLVLSSNDDTVLEIGTSRDLGFCKSVKKDGKLCDKWIDKRHTEFCEWHVNLLVEKTRRGRMEVNSMSAPHGPGQRRGERTGLFGGKKTKGKKGDDNFASEGPRYDRASASRYFFAPNFGANERSVRLLDEEDSGGRGRSQDERVRLRLAAREKEREIAIQLGEGGNGIGGEYLRVRHGNCVIGDKERDTNDQSQAVGATALSLLGNQANKVHLSPVKRKRDSIGGNAARKRTRFMNAKDSNGAGRDRLRVVAAADRVNGDPKVSLDEDDLDII